MTSRFISIGMPVYNGGETLRRALESLLAQTHSHFELIISDNASTDSLTQTITEEYARRDSRIRLTRQPVNQGAVENFLWVLGQARGDYFQWAAHDDNWSSNYLEVLANRLDAVPEAVLATPNSHVATTRRNGTREDEIIPAAPNGDREATLAVYLHEFKSCLWIYGMYRREWLVKAAPEWKSYAWFSGDVIWLWGLLLTECVVGRSSTSQKADLSSDRANVGCHVLSHDTTELATIAAVRADPGRSLRLPVLLSASSLPPKLRRDIPPARQTDVALDLDWGRDRAAAIRHMVGIIRRSIP